MAASLVAQPVPKLNSISPEWLQRGASVEVRLNGEDLGEVTNLIFSGDAGLSGMLMPTAKTAVKVEASEGGISPAQPRDEKRLTATLKLAPGASLKPREVRVVGPGGVSNPLRLEFGPLPEIFQKPPNHSLNQAQRIQLPVAVNGKISEAAQSDYYRFSAKQGLELVIEVYAFRMGSALDSSLAVLDADGKELARNEDFNGLDSLIDFKAPRDGEYVIELRDYRYEGGPDFKYRLLAGAGPYLTSIYPLGGRRGQDVSLDLKGHNLDGMEKFALRLDANAPLGPQEIRLETPRGLSNPVRFDVGNAPEFTENEPNNATNQANVISIPASVNGRINIDKDEDLFRFRSDKDQRLVIEVEARRFGSPLDALLTLRDAQGKLLQRNDDAVGADARIDFDQFKKDKEYYVSIRDLLGHGGDNYVYRLTFRQPQPDFRVDCRPDAPRIRRGGRAVVRCEISPENGFNETVRAAFTDLPPGVLAEPLLISPSVPASGLMILSAGAQAPLGSFPIRLSGSATLQGKTLRRTAKPLSGDRPVKQAFLSILEPAPFTLEAAALDVVLEQDQSAEVDLLVQRQEGFLGDIKLSAEGYSAGREPVTRSLEVPAVTLKGAETRARVKVKAKLDSEVGTRTLVFKGETTVAGNRFEEYSGAVPLTLSQFPFVLNPTLRRLSVTALPLNVQSAAREAILVVKADRRMGFKQEISLTLDGVPEGITATIEKIPEGGSEANLKLVASDKAPAGKEFALIVGGVGTFNDRTYRQKAAPVKLIVAAPIETAPAEVAHAGSSK